MIDIRYIAKTILVNFRIWLKKITHSNHLDRETMARIYIKGKGIEIGALHNPLRVAKKVNVRYVDRMNNLNLIKQYPELKGRKLVKLDCICDGETLDLIENESQDFVIANSFIEHCQNPIGAIESFFRVLKNKGILYLAIPDKRFTFDKKRPTTTFQHLMKDYNKGSEWSRKQHYEEWVRYTSNLKTEDDIQKQIEYLMQINYSIHFHVWSQNEILELLSELKKMFHFELELFSKTDNEMIVILRKI